MKEFTLVFDKKFVLEYRKLDRSIQIIGDKKLLRLKQDPFSFGKPLRYLAGLFELYVDSFRIYYFVSEIKEKILILAVKHKDEQDRFLRQLTPDKIKQLLEENL